MVRCDYCGAPLQAGKGEMCPDCLRHCYYHHASLTALNRASFLFLLVVVVPVLFWLVFAG